MDTFGVGHRSISVTRMGIGKKTNQDQLRGVEEYREGSRTKRRVERAFRAILTRLVCWGGLSAHRQLVPM